MASAIRATPDGWVEIIYYYFEDPEGSIPNWLINLAATSMLEPAIAKMIAACKSYGELGKTKPSIASGVG